MALTQTIGWRRFRAVQGLAPDESGRPGVLDTLLWPLLSRLVARPVLNRFGGRVRVAVSGGAAMPPSCRRSATAMGRFRA